MKLPRGMSEKEVLDCIDRTVELLAHKYRFGYFTLEDIKQEGRIAGIKGLEKYDDSRPLDNFMYIHIRNRLQNFKRDNFRRNDPPCKKCHAGEFCSNGLMCKKYEKWNKLNTAKSNLVSPFSLLETDTEKHFYEESNEKELLQYIDVNLPAKYRSTYLKMKAGEKNIDKNLKKEVEEFLLSLLAKYNGGEDGIS